MTACPILHLLLRDSCDPGPASPLAEPLPNLRNSAQSTALIHRTASSNIQKDNDYVFRVPFSAAFSLPRLGYQNIHPSPLCPSPHFLFPPSFSKYPKSSDSKGTNIFKDDGKVS